MALGRFHPQLEDIDKGVLPLVVTINKIPGLNTCFSCEGHVSKGLNYSLLLTKGGCVRFYVDERNRIHSGVLDEIDVFCNNFKYGSHRLFSLDRPDEVLSGLTTIFSAFELDYHDFDHLSHHEVELYLRRSRQRKKRMLEGWSELNKRMVEYVRREVSQDIDNLPYRDDI